MRRRCRRTRGVGRQRTRRKLKLTGDEEDVGVHDGVFSTTVFG
ncbi:hypothetical protein HanXRQr2_Chr03g0137321 [Helianthus annuus]|uniref:Uncharacterized protein n=1 Tax=Helianthus annuus TaxID=4232 RepID=A0A9K3JJC6_HELAN|nr:hypothetical protein HanXRQr2_Chr03g0137321 [Helianthus annuus]KAJ0945963.1 hypothetical protein HanPSC8_Chr03g0133921 [Helianthus annuus]